MKTFAYVALALFVCSFAAQADDCGKCQEVKVEVKDFKAVKTWKTVEKQVPVKVMKNVEKQVEVTVMKNVLEERQVKARKQVMVDEEYTVNEIRKKMVEETKTKQVCKLVPKQVTKDVIKREMVEQCDPCTGKKTMVPVEMKGTCTYTVNEKVMEEVPYKVTKCVEETVPVKKMRKVCKWEDYMTTVKVSVCKPFKEMRTVKVCEPVIEMRKVTEKYCETTYEPTTKTVTVQVPCEPCKPLETAAK